MAKSSLTFYSYAKCSTCRDAAKWLQQHGISVEEKPIYETPPTKAELKRMLAHYDGNIRKLFNTSGIEYRAQNLAAKLPELSEAEALDLLSQNGRLVKRPFLLGSDAGVVGFSPERWSELFAR